MSDPLFDSWCSVEETASEAKTLRVLQERIGSQPRAIELLQQIVVSHYLNPEILKRWLQKWGYDETLAVVKQELPVSKTARSGDLGEILATEYVNRKLDFTVPILRLRWRDHRELALRGDDLLAIQVDGTDRVHFLKGEAKSRRHLSAAVVEEATKALQAHDGRPGPHSINFVVKRLYDLDEDELAERIEDYLSRRTIPRRNVTHLLFTLCGNDPKPLLETQFNGYTSKVRLLAVAVHVGDHGSFVQTVFEGVSLA